MHACVCASSFVRTYPCNMTRLSPRPGAASASGPVQRRWMLQRGGRHCPQLPAVAALVGAVALAGPWPPRTRSCPCRRPCACLCRPWCPMRHAPSHTGKLLVKSSSSHGRRRTLSRGIVWQALQYLQKSDHERHWRINVVLRHCTLRQGQPG